MKFNDTVSGQIANETAATFFGKAHTEQLTIKEQRELIDYAASRGREELIDTIISLLPVELRIAAAEAYDQTHLSMH